MFDGMNRPVKLVQFTQVKSSWDDESKLDEQESNLAIQNPVAIQFRALK